MSLYFKERVEEERYELESKSIFEDPEENDMILFCLPSILSIAPNAPKTLRTCRSFITTFNLFSMMWKLELSNNNVKVLSGRLAHGLKSCHFTYKMFSDVGMCSEIYSSKRISLRQREKSFSTPAGSMNRFRKAYQRRKITKMVMFFELELPKKLFWPPLDTLTLNFCENYPEDMDSDFRFEFLKDSDFIFKCPDGTVPALKMVMNVTALKKFLNKSNNDEFVLDHAVDVVKPIITYIHSECFEMPTTYTLDFADRFLKAIKFFELEQKQRIDIRTSINLSLCYKFVTEPHDFESILESAFFSYRHSLHYLSSMVSATIAQKYYYKLIERFPEYTRITENQLTDETSRIISRITNIFKSSLFSKAILD